MPGPLALSSAFVLFTLAAGAGGEPPRWNSAAICERITASAGVDVQSKEQCRKAQDDALDELRRNWASYPGDLRLRCSEEASLDGQRSYVDLVECINLGVLAAKEDGSANPGGERTPNGRSRTRRP